MGLGQKPGLEADLGARHMAPKSLEQRLRMMPRPLPGPVGGQQSKGPDLWCLPISVGCVFLPWSISSSRCDTTKRGAGNRCAVISQHSISTVQTQWMEIPPGTQITVKIIRK